MLLLDLFIHIVSLVNKINWFTSLTYFYKTVLGTTQNSSKPQCLHLLRTSHETHQSAPTAQASSPALYQLINQFAKSLTISLTHSCSQPALSSFLGSDRSLVLLASSLVLQTGQLWELCSPHLQLPPLFLSFPGSSPLTPSQEHKIDSKTYNKN